MTYYVPPSSHSIDTGVLLELVETWLVPVRRPSHGYPLDADQVGLRHLFALDLKAEEDGLFGPLHQFIEGCGLGVATLKLRHTGNVHPGFIPLDDDCKLSLYQSIAPYYLNRLLAKPILRCLSNNC